MNTNIVHKKRNDEDDLILDLLEGDEIAYFKIYNKYRNIMLYCAKTIVGDTYAEEVLQESWILIIKALPKFEGRSSLKTWIIAIVNNTARNHLRREKKNKKYLLDCSKTICNTRYGNKGENDDYSEHNYDNLCHWDTPDALIEKNELSQVINKEIERLPNSQKSVLTLRCLEGLNTIETSLHLKQNSSNIRVLLHRACQRVNTAVHRYQSGYC